MIMDPQDGTKSLSGGNPEVLLHDRGVSGLSFGHLPSMPSSPPTEYHSFHSEPASFYQAGSTAAPDLLTRSFGQRKDEIYEASPRRRNEPLNLLDLPTDILKETLSQITSTSDLTALALTHSALHRLVTPIIYSRFSIVWPTDDGPPDSDAVDALTYGLATLVTGEDMFDRRQPSQKTAGWGYCHNCTCEHCRKARLQSKKHPVKDIRRGNHYGQYTRSFCIGNGPQDNVKEYHIKREGGKMLGTLSALAVARMPNLEKFKWDMPTGIVRDVWASLAYATTQLETVWVRFHDNRLVTPGTGPSSIPLPVGQNPSSAAGAASQTSLLPPSSGTDESQATQLRSSYGRIEHPSFSILSPLRKLSVLDIDELAYAEEMSVLIRRSLDVLRELRISIAPYLLKPGSWAVPTNALELFGGVDVTELIFSKVNTDVPQEESRTPSMHSSAMRSGDQASFRGLPRLLNETSFTVASRHNTDLGRRSFTMPIQSSTNIDHIAQAKFAREAVNAKRLRVQTLELERLPLNATVLQNAIDWSAITNLTLLHCGNHEQLWKGLRKSYSPRFSSPRYRREFSPVSSDDIDILSHSKLRSKLHSFRPNPWQENPGYRMNLKKLHTDAVSPALIGFLRETLAPNSLEELYLQDGRDYSSIVKLDSIFQGPIRRHRGSLTKVMIDSAIGLAGKPGNQQRRKWMLNAEWLAFITSGKSSSLQELAISLDYKDWHFFLRRLPRIPSLRSLYIPYIAHHGYSKHLKIVDLVSQIVDLVSLRPEIQLCYLALEDSCFQLIENRTDTQLTRVSLYDLDTMDIDDASEVNEVENEEDDNEDITDDDTPAVQPEDPTEVDSDDGEEEVEYQDEEVSEEEREEPPITVRQILFYDSMVSIFNARHGEIRP